MRKILPPGVYIVVLDVLFQHTTLQPHWGSWHSFFQVQCLCRADLLFSFSGLDIQTQNVKPVFGCFCFVLRWWTSGKITSERFCIAKCCHQEWAAHACSRFAHVLLTLAHALLTVCSRFRVLLSPYEVPFGSLRGCAHGLLTVCSRCSRFAHVLGHDVSMLMKTPISKPCHFFVVPSHVYLRHTAFRLQTPWGWFSNQKKTPTCPSLKRGCHTPASAWDMYVQRSFWAQRTQKVYPILWYYDMFLCSPKGPKSTSIDGIVQRSF